MTLKNSRKAFRKVVWKSSQEAWSRLHEEAFHYFRSRSPHEQNKLVGMVAFSIKNWITNGLRLALYK